MGADEFMAPAGVVARAQDNSAVADELATLRSVLFEAGVLAGRLSERVSGGTVPAELAGQVAAVRYAVLAAQQCAAVLARLLAKQPREGG